jgi:hypothetical protein
VAGYEKRITLVPNQTSVIEGTTEVEIERIEAGSALLKGVKKLWAENRNTLGFFPDGAFEEHAARRQIIVAQIKTGTVCGYL